VRSGTIKKRESFVPETIKKRLESYPGWSYLADFEKTGPVCDTSNALIRPLVIWDHTAPATRQR